MSRALRLKKKLKTKYRNEQLPARKADAIHRQARCM